MAEGYVTVVVHRRVKQGREADFRAAMREFTEAARDVSGHLGMQLLLPPKGGRDYTVVAKFADQAARDAFTSSDGYRARMQQLGEMTEGDPRIEELTGLEGWFATGDAPALRAPPKPKMAVSTFIGVYVVTTLLGLALGPSIEPLPLLLRNAIFSAIVVALLTWIVMPFIVRILHPWLFSDSSSGEANRLIKKVVPR